MYRVEREKVFERAQWSKAVETDVTLIEARTEIYVSSQRLKQHSPAILTLFQPDGTIRHVVSTSPWDSDKLEQFVTSTSLKTSSASDIKIRVIACNGRIFGKGEFYMEKKFWPLLERRLDLHPSTLPVFISRSGAFEQYAEFENPMGPEKRLKKLCMSWPMLMHHRLMPLPDLIIKPGGKYEMFSHGLSCTHDFSTAMTTAFLAGEYIASDEKCLEEETLSLGIIDDIVKYLESAPARWTHPLLLPTIFSTIHITRIAAYAGLSLTNEVMGLEDDLGATRVGRRNSANNVHDRRTLARHLTEDDATLPNGLPSKEQAMKLTIRINTQTTRLLVSKASQGWTRLASKTLMDCIDEYQLFPPSTTESNGIKEQLRANLHKAAYLDNYLASLQSRLMLQLSVLQSFIAQTDSQYSLMLSEQSAWLAQLSSRDSTSMKILAFITTLFLPGTFVATSK